MIFLCGSSFGLAKRSTWSEPSLISPHRLSRGKSENWKGSSKLYLPREPGAISPELQAKIGRAQDQLLTFCDYPGEVDVTNNTSERKLRPCAYP